MFAAIVQGGLLATLALARPSALRALTQARPSALRALAQARPSALRAPAGFAATVFAEEPLLESPVGLDVTPDGHVWVTGAKRRKIQRLDIRDNRDWLESELALDSVAAKERFYRRVLAPEHSTENARRVKDLDGDGLHDFRDLAVVPDRVYELVDEDHDGVADRSHVFGDELRGIVAGVAAGILVHDGSVYVTQCPDLWAFDLDGGHQRSIAHGFGVHIAYAGHNMHGPVAGPDGRIYWSIGDIGSDLAPHEGAVFRCFPDGSELELFAHGLRNPEELEFNDLGDLFTADNDGDFGDRERWYHLLEGVDCGWRNHYQYQSAGWGAPAGDFNTWMAEGLWDPRVPRPAYVHPPFALIADGPCGVAAYPGVGLPPGYEGSFFVAHFTGSAKSSQVRRYVFEPAGATWRVAADEPFLGEVAATGLDFGPDGALYVADWIGGWEALPRGRIHRVVAEGVDPSVLTELHATLGSDLVQLSDEVLEERLGHAHREVRLLAQWTLAARGARASFARVLVAAAPRIARVHALWGLGQVARRDSAALPAIVTALGDPDAEIRTQAARVLGDLRHAAVVPQLVALLDAAQPPRVQASAAMALARIGDRRGLEPALELVARVPASDAALRHAATRMLAGCAQEKALCALAHDPRVSVRLAAVVALRARASEGLVAFLEDQDPAVELEAARAIHDLPLRAGYGALAARLGNTSTARATPPDPALARRALDAAYDLGREEDARTLARAACRTDLDEDLRVEALAMLRAWETPGGRDRVTGAWQPVPGGRSPLVARRALEGEIAALLAGPERVHEGTLRAAATLAAEIPAELEQAFLGDGARSSEARVAWLDYELAVDRPGAQAALEQALTGSDEALFARALHWLGERDAGRAAALARGALEHAPVRASQRILAALQRVPGPAVDDLALEELERVEHDALPAELLLDVLELARARSSPRVVERLAAAEEHLALRDPLGARFGALSGGDPVAGRAVFVDGARAQCLRCHRFGDVDGRSGEVVGPDLTDVVARRGARHALLSILDPNQEVAAEFARERFVFADEREFLGREIGERDGVVEVEGRWMEQPASDPPERRTFARQEIVERIPDLSSMPEGLADALTPLELRDLLAFLGAR